MQAPEGRQTYGRAGPVPVSESPLLFFTFVYMLDIIRAPGTTDEGYGISRAGGIA